MKLRPFLAVVTAVALLLLSLAAGGWWLLLRQSPLALQSHSLQLPAAARFVPRNAPLSLHLQIAPDRAVAYARAVAPPRQRRQAAAAIERLRDGAFAAAGLDYGAELASWIGDDLSVALLDAPGESAPGWVLALASRDGEGARNFLQRFWQTRSLAGTDLQISSYRGMGLISGRGALLGQRPQPLATALIDDDLVLIASGRIVLEQALDVSQINELNQAGSPALRQQIERLGPGIALVMARGEPLASWLGLPPSLAAVSPLRDLVASVVPSGAGLLLQADLGGEGPLPAGSAADLLPLLASLRGSPESVLLAANPAGLLQAVGGTEPSWGALVGTLLSQGLADLGGGLPALLARSDAGPFLLARQPGGWLAGTPSDQPSPQQLEPALAAEGFLEAPLEAKGHELTVWTRLEARPVKGDPDQLLASLAGARSLQDGQAWWGEGLGVLEDQWGGSPAATARFDQLQALASPGAPLQWALAQAPARSLLASWQPWRLLSGLAGAPFSETVKGLAFSLEAPAASPGPGGDEPAGQLRLRARLALG